LHNARLDLSIHDMFSMWAGYGSLPPITIAM
jgi:hypothetical protein